MSETSLFCFVEGQTDPYIYGEICSLACEGSAFEYEIVQAYSLPTNASGKKSLRPFLSHLRRKRRLLDDFKGKKTASIFFLDKDIDDLKRVKMRSPHIIYTKYYSIENYIFRHGDLMKAIASCASMDSRRVSAEIGSEETFRKTIAETYKDWLVFCLFSYKYVRGMPNFGSHSKVNDPDYGKVDPYKLSVFKRDLQARSGFSPSEFNLKLARIAVFVDTLYASDNQDKLFNGKWYFNIVEAYLKEKFIGTPYESKVYAVRLKSTMAYSLRFNEPWADYFKSKVDTVLQKM